ncbi:hypothetical protein [Pseudomonas sp. dw_612]|uniref:hypothetical protein n=1 Tax=Pseudomonas sp. dw_612 TaxID=2720080 RepID=UPI001BD27280|nr:hypothetical protein [Pseudomonas sp. dw_612]
MMKDVAKAELEAKKNRLELAVFYLQASVRPRPALPQWKHPPRKAYSNLIIWASVNYDLLMVETNNSEEMERTFATS